MEAWLVWCSFGFSHRFLAPSLKSLEIKAFKIIRKWTNSCLVLTAFHCVWRPREQTLTCCILFPLVPSESSAKEHCDEANSYVSDYVTNMSWFARTTPLSWSGSTSLTLWCYHLIKTTPLQMSHVKHFKQCYEIVLTLWNNILLSYKDNKDVNCGKIKKQQAIQQWKLHDFQTVLLEKVKEQQESRQWNEKLTEET